MIVGIGSDIVEIERIEKLTQRFGKKFLERVFTKQEQEKAFSYSNPASSLAKRFAAKEAFAKALGTGIGQSLSWQDIEVMNLVSGKPEIVLKEKAEKLLKEKAALKVPFIHLSLSDSRRYALAMVVIEFVDKK
jgi:holo-[acyl-carrier protein] synthase